MYMYKPLIFHTLTKRNQSCKHNQIGIHGKHGLENLS